MKSKIYIAIIILFILPVCIYSQDSSETVLDANLNTQTGNRVDNANESANTNDDVDIGQDTEEDVEQSGSEEGVLKRAEADKKSPKLINKDKGLFVNFHFIGEFGPINGGAEAGIFYRFDNIIKSTHPIFEGNRLDVGIENRFLLNANITGLYVNFIPTIFMELDVRAYYNFTFNMLDYGYIGLPSLSNELTLSSIRENSGTDASGYLISVAPKFKWKLLNSDIEIANETKVSFISLGTSEYYLNRNTYEIYKQNDIEIINEFSILTETAWVEVGPSYSILYIIGTKTFVQSLDLQIDFEKYFFEGSLRLYSDLKSGFYLSSTYYPNSAFFKIKLGIEYQIL